jgi:aryl-alcohol dehydrogenase
MPMDIRAAVARKPHGQFTIETLRLNGPKPGEVLVKNVATGICHSDLSVIDQIVPLPMPIVLGHEGAGIVEAVGEGVKSVKPGDHVVLTFGTCGHCPPCDSNHPAYCDTFGPLNNGNRRMDGSCTIHDHQGSEVSSSYFSQSSFATYSIALERNAVKVRSDAPLRLFGPLGCGFITGAGTVLNVLKPGPKSTFAVFGTGALGFAAIFSAKYLGCTRIIAVDRVASRLQLAGELGATDVIDTCKEDLASRLAALGGLDFALDTTGVPAVLEAIVPNLKVRGELAMVGASTQPIFKLNVMDMIPGRVVRGVIEGDCNPHQLIPQLVDRFMEGRFPIDKLSRFYKFEDINTAADDARSGKTIKPILEF